MRIIGKRPGFGFDRFSGLYLWALFILIFGIWEPHLFLTLGTVHSIASEQAVAALLGLAVVVPLATGAFDLSIGATANLSAVVVAILQSQQHWPMWPAIAVALLIGVLIGTVNGFIIVRLQVNAFIATLGMATIVGAVETIVSGNSRPQPADVLDLGKSHPVPDPRLPGHFLLRDHRRPDQLVVPGMDPGRAVHVRDGRQRRGRAAVRGAGRRLDVAVPDLLRHGRRTGRCPVLVAERALAHLRRRAAAAGLRGRVSSARPSCAPAGSTCGARCWLSLCWPPGSTGSS